jgi:hypothetical protein
MIVGGDTQTTSWSHKPSFNISKRNDVNLLDDNIDTIKRNTQILFDASKDKTEYIVTSCQCYATDRGNRGYEHIG